MKNNQQIYGPELLTYANDSVMRESSRSIRNQNGVVFGSISNLTVRSQQTVHIQVLNSLYQCSCPFTTNTTLYCDTSTLSNQICNEYLSSCICFTNTLRKRADYSREATFLHDRYLKQTQRQNIAPLWMPIITYPIPLKAKRRYGSQIIPIKSLLRFFGNPEFTEVAQEVKKESSISYTSFEIDAISKWIITTANIWSNPVYYKTFVSALSKTPPYNHGKASLLIRYSSLDNVGCLKVGDVVPLKNFMKPSTNNNLRFTPDYSFMTSATTPQPDFKTATSYLMLIWTKSTADIRPFNPSEDEVMIWTKIHVTIVHVDHHQRELYLQEVGTLLE